MLSHPSLWEHLNLVGSFCGKVVVNLKYEWGLTLNDHAGPSLVRYNGMHKHSIPFYSIYTL
jgi:hypothetical protein